MQLTALCGYTQLKVPYQNLTARLNKLMKAKTVRIMKLTAMFLLMACLTASAEGISQITLSKKNAPLQEVFKEIQKQSGYEFFYSYNVVQKAGTVTVTVKDVTLQKAIEAALQGKRLSYQIIGKTVVIKEEVAEGTGFAPPPPPPPIEVHGRVLDEKGNPVSASVTIKGTKRGTNTDENGYFILKDVAEDATLVISAVNIETYEVKVNGKSDLANISIKTKITETQEVIVNTGYQKLKANEVTGSYVVIDNNTFNEQKGTNVLDRLNGVVPGLLFKVGKTTSNPDVGSQISIRGESTINGPMDPLIVVDDFPYTGDINNINPNDVESVTVLKDAVAISMYGAKGANGVIVITTKRGQFNQKLKVSYGYNFIITEKPNLQSLPIISTNDYVDVEQYLFNKGFFDPLISDPAHPALTEGVEILLKRRNGQISAADSALGINNLKSRDSRSQYQKLFYRNKSIQQHTLTLNGGGNNLAWLIGSNYERIRGESGAINDKINFRILNTYKPSKKLTTYSWCLLHK